MTLVHIDLRGPDGTPATGSILLSPSIRRHIEDGLEDFVVLPTPFIAELANGKVDIELDPTQPDWVWSIIERAKGGIRRYVAVPNTTEADYGDLIDVDPATLDPDEVPEAAWWAVAEDLQAQIDAGGGGGGGGGTAALWGQITGNINNQNDLAAALGAMNINITAASNAAAAASSVATAAIPASQKGAANGVATIDADGNVPNSQIGAAVMYGFASSADLDNTFGLANSKYTKPGSGIPSTDMTAAVQTSLGKADAAAPQSVVDTLTLSVTNSLTGKAAVNSPNLTGNPTAPTPAAGDNDTSIATTAFVQTAVTAAVAAVTPAVVNVASLAAVPAGTPAGTLILVG